MTWPVRDRTVATPPEAIEITTSVTESEWDAFVAADPEASGYHVWRWRRVFEEAFGHDTLYLAARRDGRIAGILPLVLFHSPLFGRFAVSLPFVNYGGVCAADDTVRQRLTDQAARAARDLRLAHVELRHTRRQLPDRPAREHKVGMYLALERDASRAWERLDRKARNQVRKAEKSGLTARVGGSELLHRFYSVFARNMRDLGTPVYSIRFFEAILSTFPDIARIFLVDQGDVTVAGALGLRHGGVFEVPWASSLREYRSQCPNNLLYWHIIEHAIETGRTTLDFGRSTPNEGTYVFKQQWGAEPRPLYWEYLLAGRAELPNLSPTNPRFSRAIALWSRLPLPLTNWIGPRIVRSIP